MPQRPTQQHQQSASPEPYPSSIVGGGSTPTKHPKPNFTATTFSHHPTTPNPDLIQPSKPSSFMLKHLSSLNIISHKPRAPHKPSQTNNNNHPPQPPPPPPPPPPPLVDTHLLQAKAMASSAIVATAPKLIAKRPSKEKPQKCKKGVERRKLEGVMKKGSDGGVHHSKVLFEEDDDLKVENSRLPPPVVVEEKHHGVVVKRHSVSVSLAPHPRPSGGGGGGGGGNRRRSFCGSKVVDLGDVFAVNGVKVVSADMPPFMQIHAVDCARKAFDSMEKFTSKTLALTLKKEFDGVYGPAWHCIVGTNFGSFVTHSVGGFLYFSMDQKLYILLFKTAVQKAG